MDSGARLMEFQDALVARSAAASFTLFKSAAEHGGFRQRRVLDFRDHVWKSVNVHFKVMKVMNFYRKTIDFSSKNHEKSWICMIQDALVARSAAASFTPFKSGAEHSGPAAKGAGLSGPWSLRRRVFFGSRSFIRLSILHHHAKR